MNPIQAGRDAVAGLLASCLARAARFAMTLADFVKKPEPWPVVIESNSQTVDAPLHYEPIVRPARARVPRPLPAATIGPCLTCHCQVVDVNLLTNFVRYCQCPQCGSVWTEPAKCRPLEGEPSYFPSEPLKFAGDRN
jgi:hypothetical protein